MNTKLIELGVALGGRFSPREPESTGCTSGYIVLDDGVRFWVTVGGYGNDGRVRFSPAYPSHEGPHGCQNVTVQRDFCGYGEPVFSGITVSAEKSADQIARDVKGRFLNVYRPLYEKATAWVNAQQVYRDGKRAMVQAANHHFSSLRSPTDNRVYAVPGYTGADYADVTVHNLTAADMARLAEFLRTL